MIAEELMNNHKCQCDFNNDKTSENKYTEKFIMLIMMLLKHSLLLLKKNGGVNTKDTTLFQNFQSKSMTTWRCPGNYK